jgi:hypothetical protein
MSKAEDLSRQYVLPFLDKQYEKYGEYRQMVLSRFDGYDMMSAYEEGYHKAEKDLELTWKDFALIRLAFDVTEANIHLGAIKVNPMTKEYYQEVLKRFYEERNKK